MSAREKESAEPRWEGNEAVPTSMPVSDALNTAQILQDSPAFDQKEGDDERENAPDGNVTNRTNSETNPAQAETANNPPQASTKKGSNTKTGGKRQAYQQ